MTHIHHRNRAEHPYVPTNISPLKNEEVTFVLNSLIVADGERGVHIITEMPCKLLDSAILNTEHIELPTNVWPSKS